MIAMMYRQVAEAVKPPRVALVRFPFGQPLGEPGNADQQRVIVEDALHLLVHATEPGTIEALPYRWRREDYAAIREQRGEGRHPGAGRGRRCRRRWVRVAASCHWYDAAI